jgi:hypothetical protein
MQHVLGNDQILAVALGGALMLLAGFLALRVDRPEAS